MQHSSKSAVIGALPLGAKIDKDLSVDDLFTVVQKHKVYSAARYHPAVWAAFRRPLADDKMRYISKDGIVRFVDSTMELASEEFTNVDRQLIDAGSCDPKLAENMILQWIDENELDVLRFQLPKSTANPKFPANDLLGELLASLELDELRRISMPLDVIQKLRNKKR